MKINYIIAIFVFGAGCYFYLASSERQQRELSSTEISVNRDEASIHEGQEIDYEDLTPEQKAEFSKDSGDHEVQAAEMEYAIEKAPENSDGYETVEEFNDDRGDLMAQALSN